MTTLHFDGFEQFAKESTGIGVALTRAGYAVFGSLTEVPGRMGGTALKVGNSMLVRTHPWDENIFSMGGSFYVEQRGTLISLEAAGRRVTVWLSDANGDPYINEHRGDSSPFMKTWYYFEVHLNRATAKMSLRINNRDEVMDVDLPTDMGTATEVTVEYGANGNILIPGIVAPVKPGIFWLDDIYSRDSAGGGIGPIVVTTRFPTANASVTWVPTGQIEGVDATNWQVASLQPTDAVNVNIRSDVIGNTDAFTSNKPLANSNAIVATGLFVLARKAAAIDAKLGGFIGNDVDATRRDATSALTRDWKGYYQTFAAVSGDTKAGIEAAPFGIFVAAP